MPIRIYIDRCKQIHVSVRNTVKKTVLFSDMSSFEEFVAKCQEFINTHTDKIPEEFFKAFENDGN